MSNPTPTASNTDWSFRIEQAAPGAQSGSRASSRPERVQTLAEWLRSQWVREQMARAVPSSIAEGFGSPVEAPYPANGIAAEHESTDEVSAPAAPSSAASTSTPPPAERRSPARSSASPTPHPTPQSSSPMP